MTTAYDAWVTSEPRDYSPYCKCGHREGAHDSLDNVLDEVYSSAMSLIQLYQLHADYDRSHWVRESLKEETTTRIANPTACFECHCEIFTEDLDANYYGDESDTGNLEDCL